MATPSERARQAHIRRQEAAKAQAIVYQSMANGVSAALVSGITNAVEQATRVQSRQLETLARALRADLIPPAEREQAHERIGLAAQRSTLAAYDRRRHKKNTPPYRITPRNLRNQRFAGGALRRALSRRDFFEATPFGLGFINKDVLFREAAHWKRLNFGAGAAGGAAPARFTVQWSGLVVASLGLEPQPQPGFSLPRGFWVTGGQRVPRGSRGQEFYPVGEAPSGIRGVPSAGIYRTKGIAASNFLDAGVQRIAREFPAEYQAMYGRLVARSGRENLSQQLNLRVPPIRVGRSGGNRRRR